MGSSWDIVKISRHIIDSSSLRYNSLPPCSVPVLQNVLTAAPGVTSRLYSVQVMSQSCTVLYCTVLYCTRCR